MALDNVAERPDEALPVGGEMRDHGPVSKARRAAATARSISALSPAGTCAMISSVAGSSTAKVSPLRGVDPLAVDQHLMFFGQERRRGGAKRGPADCYRHENLPECATLTRLRYI